MIKQNPFSIYDFLGYFIPGALVIYIFILLVTIPDFTNVNGIITILSSEKSFQLDNLLFFIIVSYALGHLINFSSSITTELIHEEVLSLPMSPVMNEEELLRIIKILNEY